MPVTDILFYSPFNMAQFIAFSKNGKPDGKGGFETDGKGRKKVGVLAWLHEIGVREAHFFATPIGHPMKLFMALVERPGDQEVPWMGAIPGFEELLRTDGLIGEISTSPQISELLAAVVKNDELDQAFIQGFSKM